MIRVPASVPSTPPPPAAPQRIAAQHQTEPDFAMTVHVHDDATRDAAGAARDCEP